MSGSIILEPDWEEPRPTFNDVQVICRRISLKLVNLAEEPFGEFLRCLRESHSNGGAYLTAFKISPDPIFDWFASRNRPSDESLLDSLVLHPAIRESLRSLPYRSRESRQGFASPTLSCSTLDSRAAGTRAEPIGAQRTTERSPNVWLWTSVMRCSAGATVRLLYSIVPKRGHHGSTASPGI